jgi:hypothetical protein
MDKRKEEINPFDKAIGDFLGIVRCLLIITDIRGYREWINNYHSKEVIGSDLPGYKLIFDTLFRMLISDIERSTSLDLSSDDVFERASFTGTPINKLPNSCEKTILIKNLLDGFNDVINSNDWTNLEISMSNLSGEVLYPLYNVRGVSSVVERLSAQGLDTVVNYSSMFQTYIFLNDTSRGIPHGYMSAMIDEATFGYRHRVAQTLGNAFEGYKFGIQYLWAELLKDKFQESVVSKIHNALNWGKFDEYFDKIQTEIINPLEQSTGAHMGYDTSIVTKQSPKRFFQKLLEKKPSEIELSPAEALKRMFLWYPIQLIDSSDYSFSGIPTFIPLLMGHIQIKRRSGDKSKAKIIRIIHGRAEDHRRSYSYAILSELGGYISDASGWLLFFDCCDDRGSTSIMFKKVETLLARYMENEFIEITNTRIEKETFLTLIKKETKDEGVLPDEEH